MNFNNNNLFKSLKKLPKKIFKSSVSSKNSNLSNLSKKNLNSPYLQKKQKRKKKLDLNGRNYICSICKKAYLSYPALYTHNRNYHDIIPVTGKPKIFRNKIDSNNKSLFKYNQSDFTLNDNKDITYIINFIIKTLLEICKKYFYNQDSIFYKNNYIFSLDSFIIILNNTLLNQNYIINLPNKKSNIYNVIIIYIIKLIKITFDEEFKILLIYFSFFFKEYLNMVGWVYKKKMFDIGLISNSLDEFEKNSGKDFCLENTCEDIQDMIEDFVEIYILMVDDLKDKQKEIADICQNFFFWLNVNKIISYKLKRKDEENE
jgi:hypothetical protein